MSSPHTARGRPSVTEQRFAERATRARGQRLRRWFLLVLVLVLVLVLAWVVGLSSVLATHRVSVSGADRADRTTIEEIAGQEVGVPLARVRGDDLASRITDEVPSAARVDVTREWPHTLNVKVTSRVPVLAVRRAGGGFRLLDIEGVAIRTVSDAPRDVAAVTAEGGAKVSGRGVQAARGMLQALPAQMRERVTGITVDEADQITFSLEGAKIIWGDSADPELKVKVILILLEKKPEAIDVSAPDTPVTRG